MRVAPSLISCCLAALSLLACTASFAQEQPPGPNEVAVKSDPPAADVSGPFRKLAPGVMRTIKPLIEEHDGFSRHDLVEVLAEDPNFGVRATAEGITPAKDVRFAHDVWGLEFSFKPVRFIDVDVPNLKGQAIKKTIWYMVYSVKNTGEKPVEFIPQFILESHDTNKAYPARLIPVATPAIRRREDPNRPLLNVVEIAGEIPPSTAEEDRSVWGVVTWENVDPATDHFSIFVTGLTNAYQWEDAAGAYQKGDAPATGRTLTHKTLQLKFWRPSDRFLEHEDEIRFGKPGEVDYAWVYR
jgi:hypothetical protein